MSAAPVTSTEKPARKRQLDRRQRSLRAAFVRNYTTPGAPTYHNGTKSAIAAGYSAKTAGAQASYILRDVNVSAAVDEAERKFAAKLEVEGVLQVKHIQDGHKMMYERCLALGNEEVATRNLEDLGKTIGAYAPEIQVDVTVQVFDPALVEEASRLGMVLLERAGARGLAAAIDVEHEPVAALPEPAPRAIVDVPQPDTSATRQDAPGSAPAPALDSQVQAEPQAVEPAPTPKPLPRCRRCGIEVTPRRTLCPSCQSAQARERVMARRAGAGVKGV